MPEHTSVESRPRESTVDVESHQAAHSSDVESQYERHAPETPASTIEYQHADGSTHRVASSQEIPAECPVAGMPDGMVRALARAAARGAQVEMERSKAQSELIRPTEKTQRKPEHNLNSTRSAAKVVKMEVHSTESNQASVGPISPVSNVAAQTKWEDGYEDYRNKARRLAVEKLTELRQRERDAYAVREQVEHIRPAPIVRSSEPKPVVLPMAVLPGKVKETLTAAIVATKEIVMPPTISAVPIEVKNIFIAEEEMPTLILESDPVQGGVELAEVEYFPHIDGPRIDLQPEAYEIIAPEISSENLSPEDFVYSLTELTALSLDKPENVSPDEAQEPLTLERVDAEKIFPALRVAAENTDDVEGVTSVAEFKLVQSEAETDDQVIEIVQRAEVISIVAELVDTIEQLNAELLQVQYGEVALAESPAVELVELVVEAPEAKTKDLEAKIEYLLERLVLVDQTKNIREIIAELLTNDTVKLFFENMENDEDYTQYLSERLGTDEFLRRAQRSLGLLQRTVGYVQRLIGTSTLQLYGLYGSQLYASK